jgi:hypothetical protein
MINFFNSASKYFNETVFQEKKSFELDPTTTVARVALFHFMSPGTKPFVHNYSICYDFPSTMQPLVRRAYQVSREDLSMIDIAIAKAIKTTPPYGNTFYKKLFEICVLGLKALKVTYKSSQVTCMAIEKIIDYIQIEISNHKGTEAKKIDEGLYTDLHIRALAADFELIEKKLGSGDNQGVIRYCRRIIDFLDDQDESYKKDLKIHQEENR